MMIQLPSAPEIPVSTFVPVQVVSLGRDTGVLRSGDTEIKFQRSAVAPVAEPLTVGREGLALVTSPAEGRLDAVTLQLEPAKTQYVGTVKSFAGISGFITIDETTQDVRFRIKQWSGHALIKPGLRVTCRVALTSAGNYRAYDVVDL